MPQLRNQPLYVRILSMIAVCPMTAIELRDQLACEVGETADRTIRSVLYQLHSRGLVFIAGWTKAKHGPDQPAWKMGAEPDVPRPPSRMSGKTFPTFRPSRQEVRCGTEMIAFANLVEAMQDAAYSCVELTEISGNCRHSVQMTIRLMRAAGIVHVALWERSRRNGPWIPHYMLGCKRDKPRPKKKPQEQVWKDDRQRRTMKRAPQLVISDLAHRASVFHLAQAI